MNADWENFIASLDPAAVEAERMRVHGDLDQERPGSVTDQRMRTAHAFVANDYWDRVNAGHPLPLTDEQWAARRAFHLADADAEIARRGYDTTDHDTDTEAAIRSYSQTHHERHAA